MTIPKEAIYSGEIDWNSVYRKFHQLDDMTNTIEEYLDGKNSTTIFSGFGEIAENLSYKHSIKFVEYSDYMVEAAHREFSKIREIVHADILEHLATDTSSVIMILCRITAYWQTPECIEKFITAIKAFPRKLVLIDFFDAARLNNQSKFEYELSSSLSSTWHIYSRDNVEGKDLSIELVKLHGEYIDGQKVIDFDTQRAFYRSEEILNKVNKRLPDYTAKISEPIIKDDPSFLLVIRPNK